MIEIFVILCKQFNLVPFLLVLNACYHKDTQLVNKKNTTSETKEFTLITYLFLAYILIAR